MSVPTPMTKREFKVDLRHSTDELLDAVFALMETDTSILGDVIPEPKPWILCIDDDYDYSRILSPNFFRAI